MEKLEYARHFSDLIVWRKSRAVTNEIFSLSQSFPVEERYSLTDQIRRSSRSIGAQIAEAWAKRRYEKHFISKLTDADGEQNETQHWLITAYDAGYANRELIAALGSQCKEIGAMIGKMVSLSDQFCESPEKPCPSPKLQEPLSESDFFTSTPFDLEEKIVYNRTDY